MRTTQEWGYSRDESIVWQEFQRGKNTSAVAKDHTADGWSPAYVSRVLNRARKKIVKALKEHANSHRLDIEALLDYKGILIGFDYQTSTQSIDRIAPQKSKAPSLPKPPLIFFLLCIVFTPNPI